MPLPRLMPANCGMGDAVVEHHAARLQHAVDLAEVLRKAGDADVLEHAHARDLVVDRILRQIEVVAQLDLHVTRQASRDDLARHVLVLVLRQRDAVRVHAVVLGGVEDEPAPAAADVEEALAGREAQLAADVVELRDLRVVERLRFVLEVRARVHHALVEPHAVERVADVVVVRDVAAVGAALVQEGLEALPQLLPAVVHGADHRLRDAEHPARAAGEIDVAVDVRAGERSERRLGERLQAPPGAGNHFHRRRRRQRHPRAVGEHERDRQVAAAVAVGDDALERRHGEKCIRPPWEPSASWSGRRPTFYERSAPACRPRTACRRPW